MLSPRRLDGEEGVTAIIVALSIVALFGMLVLVVDVGGLLYRRREMVNASDAAALAAARTCVVPTDVDPRSPEQAADEWAADNSVNAITSTTNITAMSGCRTDGNGYVSVQYSANQNLFFAPVLGFSNKGQVTTAATAIFGSAGGTNPLPLVMYQTAFHNCKLEDNQAPGTKCYIWEDNNNTGTSQNGFGFLDLRQDPGSPRQYGWDTQNRTATCTNPGSDLKTWISNYPDPNVGDRSVNYPLPTWVCLSSGGNQAAWGNDQTKTGPMYSLVGKTVVLPLNRCYASPSPGVTDGQVAKDGSPVPCGETPNQYDIIGFGAVKIDAIYTPMEAQGTGDTCSMDFQGYTGDPGQDGDVTTNQWFNLDSFGTWASSKSTHCSATPPDSVSAPTITPQTGPAYTLCPTGVTTNCDYGWDAGARTVTWYGPSTKASGSQENKDDLHISFDWSNAGPCGFPPAGNNSGHCMVVEVVKVKLGGSGPGLGDPESNLKAFKLCDPTIPKSCDPIQVP